MNKEIIFLRLKTEKCISQSKRFSILEGLKSLFYNLKVLFTGRLLSSGNGWIIKSSNNSIIDDVSLVMKDGKPEFIKTPTESKEILIEMTKNLDLD